MANYFQIFPPLVFSYRLFIFTNRGNFQARTILEFEESLPRKTASKRGLDRSQMEQPIKKTNFLTLPDLAFGFVHKRSGNEIMVHAVSRACLQKSPRPQCLSRKHTLHVTTLDCIIFPACPSPDSDSIQIFDAPAVKCNGTWYRYSLFCQCSF